MNFRVGQKVVCVYDGSHLPDATWFPGEEIVAGEKYTVFSAHADRRGNRVLWLKEVARNPIVIEYWGDARLGYGQYRFRPLVEKKTDISIFTNMLTDTEQKVSA